MHGCRPPASSTTTHPTASATTPRRGSAEKQKKPDGTWGAVRLFVLQSKDGRPMPPSLLLCPAFLQAGLAREAACLRGNHAAGESFAAQVLAGRVGGGNSFAADCGAVGR